MGFRVAKVKFVSGEERTYDGDAAALEGPLFTVSKWQHHNGRRIEREHVFEAAEVAWAEVSARPDLHVIVGGGQVNPN